MKIYPAIMSSNMMSIPFSNLFRKSCSVSASNNVLHRKIKQYKLDKGCGHPCPSALQLIFNLILNLPLPSTNSIAKSWVNENEQFTLLYLNIAHNHVFSSANIKIYAMSTTPPLNTTLFLCFQIFHIISKSHSFPYYIIFLIIPCKGKVHKMINNSMMPNKIYTYPAITLVPNLCATKRLKKTCWIASSLILHNEHRDKCIIICLLVRLSLVCSFPLRTLHTYTCAGPAAGHIETGQTL